MVEASEYSGLSAESLLAVAIVGKRFGQHLQRHVPVELRIPRSIHFTHPAFADLGGDGVGAEGGAGFESHQSMGTRRSSSVNQFKTMLIWSGAVSSPM